MGVLERRSELNEEIRLKHREFSELKSLKVQFEEIGQKLKEEGEDGDVDAEDARLQEKADLLLSSGRKCFVSIFGWLYLIYFFCNVIFFVYGIIFWSNFCFQNAKKMLQ